MAFNHRVFIINYQARIQQGTWHAEDDFEFQGWGGFEAGKSVILAPSKEVAIAHLSKSGWIPEQEFTVVSVEDLRLDHCLLKLDLS